MALEGFYWVVVDVDAEELASTVLYHDETEAQMEADDLIQLTGDEHTIFKLG